MCFSNLPISFDEEGNPYLAEEADDVTRPSANGDGAEGDVRSDADNGEGRPAGIAEDPRGAYEEILRSVPAPAREHLEGAPGDERPERDADAAEGD